MLYILVLTALLHPSLAQIIPDMDIVHSRLHGKLDIIPSHEFDDEEDCVKGIKLLDWQGNQFCEVKPELHQQYESEGKRADTLSCSEPTQSNNNNLRNFNNPWADYIDNNLGDSFMENNLGSNYADNNYAAKIPGSDYVERNYPANNPGGDYVESNYPPNNPAGNYAENNYAANNPEGNHAENNYAANNPEGNYAENNYAANNLEGNYIDINPSASNIDNSPWVDSIGNNPGGNYLESSPSDVLDGQLNLQHQTPAPVNFMDIDSNVGGSSIENRPWGDNIENNPGGNYIDIKPDDVLDEQLNLQHQTPAPVHNINENIDEYSEKLAFDILDQLFDNHNEDNPGSNYVEIKNNPDNTLNDQLNLQETQDHNVEKNMDEYSKNEASDKGGHKWEQ